jgi:hypothetical protein
MRIFRSISEPIRTGLAWHEKWRADDGGLIACWEGGRLMQVEKPDLASQAAVGRLLILPWKGGLPNARSKRRWGTLHYLAMWRGIRGEDLDIDPDRELILTCTETGLAVTFTADKSRYLDTED